MDPAPSHVVLSRVDAFPDSLTGSALTRSGPLLFTDPATLTAATRAEIDRLLQPPAVVYLLGGSSAISPDIEAELAAAGYTHRVASPVPPGSRPRSRSPMRCCASHPSRPTRCC